MNVSAIKIIKSDYIALLSLIATIVLPILYIDFAHFGFLKNIFSRGRVNETGDATFFLIIACAGVSIALPLLVARIRNIKKHFLNGVEIRARVLTKRMHKDRGRIEYSYQHNGTEYITSNAVHKSFAVDSLKEGQLVTAVVEPQNPKKAFIKELYI